MKRTLFGLSAFVLASQSMATLYFNGDATTRDLVREDFRAAAGVVSGQYFEDFESYSLDTNMLGVDLGGGLTVGNSGTGAVEIRGIGSFGGSDPIGQKGLWHNESAWLELNFTEGAGLYIGGIDIDHSEGTIRLTYDDATTEAFAIDNTLVAGDSGEFWGFVAEDGKFITKVEFSIGGDDSWGLDNIEYGVVPEPGTMALLGLGAAAVAARRKKKV